MLPISTSYLDQSSTTFPSAVRNELNSLQRKCDAIFQLAGRRNDQSHGSHCVDSLTPEQLTLFTHSFIEGVRNHSIDFSTFFPANRREEGERLVEELMREYPLSQMICKKILSETDQEIAQLEQEIAHCVLEEKRGAEIVSGGKRKIAEADALQLKSDKLAHIALIKEFCSIFKIGKITQLPPDERLNDIFNQYLACGSLINKKVGEGPSFPCISSMRPIINYLGDHQESGINLLDFRPFSEISDIKTLADYLETPDGCKIIGVAFKGPIPPEDRALLEKAKNARAARQSSLKIVYSP